MNEADLVSHGIKHGDVVKVQTAIPGHEERNLRVTAIAHDIAPGSVAAYYPEANNLCPLDYRDKESGTPSYKSIPVRIHKAP